jgi:hypothetical protein
MAVPMRPIASAITAALRPDCRRVRSVTDGTGSAALGAAAYEWKDGAPLCQAWNADAFFAIMNVLFRPLADQCLQFGFDFPEILL